MWRIASLLLPVATLIWSCKTASDHSAEVVRAATPSSHSATYDKLSDYWYEGKAEISTYELLQNRYDNVHPGQAVLIFVTEDFLTDKQVKNDRYKSDRSIPILKNNQIRKFPTGIYDYSMMTSVFTPVNLGTHPNSLKVSTTSQEWCGHTYTQVNLTDGAYGIQLHSYFELEADTAYSVDRAFLEDELLNRIRIDPTTLPIGNFPMIPSTIVSRLMHIPMEALSVKAQRMPYRGDTFGGEDLQVYRVEYPSLDRTLEVIYEGMAPFKIVGWQDTYPSMFDQQLRTTIARRTHERRSAYWKENGLKDMSLRQSLGL